MSRIESDVLLGGRYRLVRRLATGGMGTVWEAEDTVLSRRVAVKVLSESLSSDEHFIERFRREARAAAGLSHPNVAGIFDYGVDDDTHFIVMELLGGETLAARLARGPLPWREAVRIAERVADALDEAHAAGIVHRDVKPGNIMLTDDGGVKVMDFGIAAAASAVPITVSGTTMGTATYIAPEQASGHRATPASDVYSLGVVLYEMLGGRPPFSGESPVAVAAMHAHDEPPPLRTLAPDVPDHLAAACHRALAKNPADRPPSARAFAAMLRSPADATAPIAPADQEGQQTQILTPIPGTAVLPQVGGTGTPPQGIETTEAEAAPPVSPARAPTKRRPRRSRSGALLGLLAAVVILLIALAILLKGTGPQPIPPNSPGPTPSSSQQIISMPNVKGMKEAAARDQLKAAGLNNIQVVTVAGNQGIVVDQNPGPGQSVTPDTTVTLYVGSTPPQPKDHGKGKGKGKGG